MTDTKFTIHLTVAATAGAPRVPIEIAPDISAAALRKQASEATKIPLTALKLIFRGRMISNDDAMKAVEEYKLEEGSVLHCMGKPVHDNAPAVSTTGSATAAAPASALPSVNLIPPTAAAAGGAVPPAGNATGTTSADPLSEALQTMRANNPPQVYKTAVETLQKLLSKIVENPLEEKFRRVKKENPAFSRKLGGLNGGDAAMKAAGFVIENDESGQPVYQMHASADAWPKLLAAQTTISNAVRDAQAASVAPPVPPPMPGFPSMNPGMGMGGMPDMSQAAANLMQNPQALQGMLQNPMVQNMMRSDPRFANNPMAQQMLESLFQNPAAMQQSLQMMQDPNFQQQMQNVQQQMQQNPAMMQQMMQQMQQMQGMFGGGMPAGGGAPSGSSQPAQPATQQQGNQQSDEDQTEEEMIAEAIRRSLQDNNNNNN